MNRLSAKTKSTLLTSKHYPSLPVNHVYIRTSPFIVANQLQLKKSYTLSIVVNKDIIIFLTECLFFRSLSLRESVNIRRTDTLSAQGSTLESGSEKGITFSVQALQSLEQEPVLRESVRRTDDAVR